MAHRKRSGAIIYAFFSEQMTTTTMSTTTAASVGGKAINSDAHAYVTTLVLFMRFRHTHFSMRRADNYQRRSKVTCARGCRHDAIQSFCSNESRPCAEILFALQPQGRSHMSASDGHIPTEMKSPPALANLRRVESSSLVLDADDLPS